MTTSPSPTRRRVAGLHVLLTACCDDGQGSEAEIMVKNMEARTASESGNGLERVNISGADRIPPNILGAIVTPCRQAEFCAPQRILVSFLANETSNLGN